MTTPRPIARLLRLAHALVVSLAVAGLVVIAVVAGAAAPAGAASYTPVSGEGSSWSAGALDQWIADVHADGIQINYTANGSTAGREDFIQGQTDFAASDIPFSSGQATNYPTQPYQYMPDVAGGLALMFNLNGNDGQRITNLNLNASLIGQI